MREGESERVREGERERGREGERERGREGGRERRREYSVGFNLRGAVMEVILRERGRRRSWKSSASVRVMRVIA